MILSFLFISLLSIAYSAEWFFAFGYVMAGSRNSWQQTIDAAPPSEMLPAEVLSGQVVFETAFYDDKEFLCKNSVRIYYV